MLSPFINIPTYFPTNPPHMKTPDICGLALQGELFLGSGSFPTYKSLPLILSGQQSSLFTIKTA